MANKQPWLGEPDVVEFTYKGFNCLIIRMKDTGHLCGYVGLPKTNQWYNKDYEEIPLEVHGGLTYSNSWVVTYERTKHSTDNLWWVGFDCAHGGDIVPSKKYSHWDGATYKTVEFVRKELESLVEQILSREVE